MALLVMTFDTSTGRLFTQKVGSDQIANLAIISGKAGSGILLQHPIIKGYGASQSPSTGDLMLQCIDDKLGVWTQDGTEMRTLSISSIGNQNVVSAKIGANIIATPHILNQGILSASIATQIGAAHFFTPPFTSGYVIIGQGSGVTPVYDLPPAGAPGDNTITSAKIASGQVGDGHIYPASILSGKIGANVIATPHIANQGILSASIGAAVIGGVHIYSGSIADTNLANALITSSKIASGIVGIPHFQPWASGKVLVGQGTTTTPITADQQAGVVFVIDGGGSVITSGLKGYLEVPFGAAINRCTLLGDVSGNINIDIWKNTYANFQALAAANSICSSWKPHTSGDIKYQDSILSNWVNSIASGDILAYYANAASSITKCTVSLGVYK